MVIYNTNNNNLCGIVIDIPQSNSIKCRFNNLNEFFKLYHENIIWFEIVCGFQKCTYY